MTLFEECKTVLKDDFHIINNIDFVLNILNKYPIQGNSIDWDRIRYKDYDDLNLIFEDINLSYSRDVFILADDDDIPVFKSNLKLVVKNIYDVMALSPILFIFNDDMILSPIFPSYAVRVGFWD